MLRFSLLTLLGVVLVAAIGSAALENPTDIWRLVVVTGTVIALLVATLSVKISTSLVRSASITARIVRMNALTLVVVYLVLIQFWSCSLASCSRTSRLDR